MLEPSIGHNKYLIPPPLPNDSLTFIDLVVNVRETIYIDEVKKFMRLKKQNTRFWYNGYLTFQNLRRDSNNSIQMNDKDNMWIPDFESINSESIEKCKRTEERETFTASPTQNYVFNGKNEPRNAFLFKVSVRLTSIMTLLGIVKKRILFLRHLAVHFFFHPFYKHKHFRYITEVLHCLLKTSLI